ncbi:MAG: cupin domain-containing protein [Alphaproteobacteria bacterium]|nr:cupin domain-containing protein [Alphaproteobacteria bacterium]
MDRTSISPDDMENTRVARYSELKSSAKAFVDALIPGYERDIYNIIGRGVVEDKELEPPILDNRDFNVGFIKAEPGKGASPHIHETNEVFMPLTGKWGIYWINEDGQRHEAILGPYDTVSVPVGLSRGFRNASDETAMMLAIVGGTDPGKVHWPQETIDEAREHGIGLDENQDLVLLDK